ncbi:unnamed protein product [Caenorhabditis bovis]|uniref:DUF19 domain-containing protein n=1 Tax=Caenorhabditis bovis TaxID=2654633 RepID=A0A8S1EJ18_9PELO|nr:unnamed protein product [Caenorhabditis bovis]
MRIRLLLFVGLCVAQCSCEIREKRQLTIDDIISGALNLVRPIFDTSKPIVNEGMLKKPAIPTQDDMRDTSILGSRSRTALDDLPLCKGNSGICRFISCSADNFKKDPTFSNLQLAAQVIGDAKLRKTISANPEAVTTVCKEQGLDDDQCKLFSKGFQIIDKVITTIEKPDSKEPEKPAQTEDTASPESHQAPQMDDPSIPQNDENLKSWADYDINAPAPPSHQTALGSKTWSSNPDSRTLQPLEIRNDLISSWTPIPFLAPPTIPPAPPLAFKTVPSFVLPPIKVPNLDNGFFFSTDKFNFNNKDDNTIKRFRRDTDYYDDVKEKKPEESAISEHSSGTDTDYYGTFDDDESKKVEEPPSGLKQCVHLLGIGV